MKCIRNHLKIHRFGQAGEHLIDYNHYRLLYEVECNEQVRAVPKLSKAHVDPDNLRKMNVRLATQLFSRSTALGIRIYRNERRPGLESSEGTETFTRLLNDLFDALNAKLPLQGIRKTSSGIKIINDFIDLLNLTERNHITNNGIMFASAVTMQSLRVTLLSVRDIIQELLTEGAIYVLTAKLNQDPLERFFGMVRSFGGDEDHPTVITFSYIYRLLSLYTPIKTALRGNIDGEPSTVLATMEEAMRLKKKDKQSSQDRLELLISGKLSRALTNTEPKSLTFDHDYTAPNAHDCIMFYISGYIVYKFSKRGVCKLCLRDIEAPSDVAAGRTAYLTALRSFKEGSLKQPSLKMFTAFQVVEETVAAVLDGTNICGDIFWLVLDALEETAVPRLATSRPRDDHEEQLTLLQHSKVVKSGRCDGWRSRHAGESVVMACSADSVRSMFGGFSHKTVDGFRGIADGAFENFTLHATHEDAKFLLLGSLQIGSGT
ncbi:hypothetical protein HPB47_012835 [Ixodes persulcatus]|uniref:Uncharacterized protein n=1 Tax=Ixodes persulcatus TaxID=34615 RepID=A0AC60NSE9_IXOPE|nr:hypothetical protein HPB47_012835 [Ixodes persulcatus]